MPRLIPNKAAALVVAVEDIIDSSGAHWNQGSGIRAYRGQVLPTDDSLVRRFPDKFEPAPEGVRFGPPPGPDELAAVAQAYFVDNGRMVEPGRRFYPYDELVRERPGWFRHVVPFR